MAVMMMKNIMKLIMTKMLVEKFWFLFRTVGSDAFEKADGLLLHLIYLKLLLGGGVILDTVQYFCFLFSFDHEEYHGNGYDGR